jgi:lysophospholipase L1-like esterase
VKIQNGQAILFIGDSITDCGRRGHAAPLGDGYVKFFADLFIARNPAQRINIINKGISGDVVIGLQSRWADDVLRNRPDWLSVKIGINDLHRTLNQNPQPVPPPLYREAYNDILARTRDALPQCGILLIDPFYISTDRAPTSFRSRVLELLPEYLRIVDEMSERYDTLHVKTHAVFLRLLETHEPDVFCPEPVHPNVTGHLVIADAVYDALSEEQTDRTGPSSGITFA